MILIKIRENNKRQSKNKMSIFSAHLKPKRNNKAPSADLNKGIFLLHRPKKANQPNQPDQDKEENKAPIITQPQQNHTLFASTSHEVLHHEHKNKSAAHVLKKGFAGGHENDSAPVIIRHIHQARNKRDNQLQGVARQMNPIGSNARVDTNGNAKVASSNNIHNVFLFGKAPDKH